MSFKQFGGNNELNIANNFKTNNLVSNSIVSDNIVANDISSSKINISGNLDMNKNKINNVDTINFVNKIDNKESSGRITTTGDKFYIEGGDISENSGIIRFSKWKTSSRVIDIDTNNNRLNTSGVAIVTTNYSDLDAQVKQNEDDISGSINISHLNTKLDLSGGTMTGNIDMSNNDISNIKIITVNEGSIIIKNGSIDDGTASYPLIIKNLTSGGQDEVIDGEPRLLNRGVGIDFKHATSGLSDINNDIGSRITSRAENNSNNYGAYLEFEVQKISGGYTGTTVPMRIYSNKFEIYEEIFMNNNLIRGIENGSDASDAVNKSQLDTKLDLAGGTMTGNIDMSNNVITNVAEPTDLSDVATKNYVDTNFYCFFNSNVEAPGGSHIISSERFDIIPGSLKIFLLDIFFNNVILTGISEGFYKITISTTLYEVNTAVNTKTTNSNNFYYSSSNEVAAFSAKQYCDFSSHNTNNVDNIGIEVSFTNNNNQPQGTLEQIFSIFRIN